EFLRDRPARRAADHTETLLQPEVVDLVDHPVDVIGQFRALGSDLVVIGERLVDAPAEPRARVDGKAPVTEPRERLVMGAREGGAGLAPSISKEFERPARSNRGIELAQRSRGGVPGIGEDRLACGRTLLVQGKKAGALQIDLAANLDQLGPFLAGERFGYRR